MSDWTTKPLSDISEIDLHPNLNSFPAVIRNADRNKSVLLSRTEALKLMSVLIDHFEKEDLANT